MNLGLQQQRGADGIWHDMATQMGSRNNPHVAGVMIDTEPLNPLFLIWFSRLAHKFGTIINP